MPSARRDLLATVDTAALWGAVEAALEQIGVGVFVARIAAKPPTFLYVSERAAQIVGHAREDLIGSPIWKVIPPADQQRIGELIATRDGAVPVQIPMLVVRPDGTRVPTEAGAFRVATPDGVLSFVYMRDLTAERAAVEALSRSETRFRYVIEAAPDGVVILVGGRIAFVNPTAARLLGAEDPAGAIGQPIDRFLPPDHSAVAAERIATMFRTGEPMGPTEYGVLADAERVVEITSIRCEWEGAPAVLAFARDVTARKALAQRLVEADRLTALGTLAAGVAHEINNPLTYTQLSLQRVERSIASAGLAEDVVAALRGQLADAQHGIRRVASITSTLRTFARPDEAPPGPIDVVAAVDRALAMTEGDVRHRARLVRSVADVPSAVANASRLEQVVVNLILNALQALRPDDSAPRIEVAVTSAGDWVSIRVSDTGCGIPAPVRHRVFEPFFTTKPVGEGMGLGLAVCRAIIDGFGGEIRLESTEGVGTTVTVALRTHVAAPVITATDDARAPTRRRVLVVDDDTLVRKALARALDGYHDVTVAEDGDAALALLARMDFDAILCDVMMPGADGRELYRRVAESSPGRERGIVFMTGGTLGAGFDDFLVSAPNRCLQKPFGVEDALAAIAEVAG